MEEDVNDQGNRVFATPTETHLPIHKEARPIPSPHEKGGTICIHTEKSGFGKFPIRSLFPQKKKDRYQPCSSCTEVAREWAAT